MSTCINCQLEVTSSYCPACGQKNPVKKINAANMWNDFLSRVYGFDGMFPRTLRDLTIRPGEVARSYVTGNRVKYYGPVGYFFLMITVYLLLASLLGVNISEFMQASSPVSTYQQEPGQQEINKVLMNWISDNMRVMTFVIALFSVFFSWLYFLKSKYNLIESSVLVFYTLGHLTWLNIIGLVIYNFTGVALNAGFSLLLTIVFLLYAFSNFYTHQAKWKVVIKGFLSLLSAYFLMIIISIVVFNYIIATNEEFRDKIGITKEEGTN